MQTQEFWKIIDQSIQQKNSIDKNDQGETLFELMKDFPLEKLLGFQNKVNQLKEELESRMFQDVAFMMKYKDNETAYSGFKNWVISLGEEHYNKTKKSPSYLFTLEDSKLFVVGRPYFPDLDWTACGIYYDKVDDNSPSWDSFFEKTNRLNEVQKGLNNHQKKDHHINR